MLFRIEKRIARRRRLVSFQFAADTLKVGEKYRTAFRTKIMADNAIASPTEVIGGPRQKPFARFRLLERHQGIDHSKMHRALSRLSPIDFVDSKVTNRLECKGSNPINQAAEIRCI